MKNHILLLLYIVLLFFLHFGFQINGINTRYLATILLLISCICVSSALIRLPMLKNSVFQKLLNSTIIYNIIVWLIPICLMTMDFSMLSGTIRFFICMVDIFLLWALLPRQYREYQLEFIVYIYLIQSVVILAAFVSPSLLEIVRQFQFESVTEITDRYLNYGTFRGLALAGDQFYGLTTSFGLISIFVMKFYVESSNIKWIGVFFVFFAANMFVGRTGFIGFFAALGYLFLSSKKNKFKSLFKIFVFTILLISILYLALPSSLKEVIDESVFAYAFQIFYNYKDSGSFSTSSSDRVAEMWQISIGFFTYLLGDGRFSNPDGTYYGKIDVGYLRQILYGGIAFLIYSVVLTWRMLTNYSKRYKIRQPLFEYIVLAYLLVIHTKGLSFMYCPEHMMIILFYYLHLNREKLAVFR